MESVKSVANLANTTPSLTVVLIIDGDPIGISLEGIPSQDSPGG
jgi:hypothetical protein